MSTIDDEKATAKLAVQQLRISLATHGPTADKRTTAKTAAVLTGVSESTPPRLNLASTLGRCRRSTFRLYVIFETLHSCLSGNTCDWQRPRVTMKKKTNDRPRIFHCRAKTEGRRPRAGMGFLGRGSNPLPSATKSGGSLWAPPARYGAEPRPPKGCPQFSALMVASHDTIR